MHALVWSGMQPRHGSEPCGLNVHWHRLEERAYLHFVWRKYLGVYFTSDDGHHLQFHIYRWHSPSRSETMGLIKSLCRVKILYTNATLGPVQFGLYQRRELLPDSSLRWQECCRSLSQSLPPSLSLALPPPVAPHWRHFYLHVHVLRHYSARWSAHCRIRLIPVHSASYDLFLESLFNFKPQLRHCVSCRRLVGSPGITTIRSFCQEISIVVKGGQLIYQSSGLKGHLDERAEAVIRESQLWPCKTRPLTDPIIVFWS